MRVFDFVSPGEHVQELLTYMKNVGQLDDSQLPIGDEDIFNNLSKAIENLNCLAEANVGDADLESVFNSLASLVPSVTQSDQATALVNQLCDKIQQPSFNGRELLIYRPLRNLFYAMGDQMYPVTLRHQYALLCAMLNMVKRCDKSQYPSRVVTLEETLQYLDSWKCNVSEKRHCLRLLHGALINGPQGAAPAKVMFQLLSTYTTDADAAKADEDARECVRTAINDPDTYMFNHLFRLRPVQQLSGQPIYELLKVFDSGMIEDYLKFRESQGQFLENTMGLSHELYMEKMRILTMMSLCESARRISRQDLGARLLIEDADDLEEFVIRAVQTKMVQAEIDDAEDCVILRGAKPRCFDKSQWKLLLGGLKKWHCSVETIKKYFETECSS